MNNERDDKLTKLTRGSHIVTLGTMNMGVNDTDRANNVNRDINNRTNTNSDLNLS